MVKKCYYFGMAFDGEIPDIAFDIAGKAAEKLSKPVTEFIESITKLYGDPSLESVKGAVESGKELAEKAESTAEKVKKTADRLFKTNPRIVTMLNSIKSPAKKTAAFCQMAIIALTPINEKPEQHLKHFASVTLQQMKDAGNAGGATAIKETAPRLGEVKLEMLDKAKEVKERLLARLPERFASLNVTNPRIIERAKRVAFSNLLRPGHQVSELLNSKSLMGPEADFQKKFKEKYFSNAVFGELKGETRLDTMFNEESAAEAAAGAGNEATAFENYREFERAMIAIDSSAEYRELVEDVFNDPDNPYVLIEKFLNGQAQEIGPKLVPPDEWRRMQESLEERVNRIDESVWLSFEPHAFKQRLVV